MNGGHFCVLGAFLLGVSLSAHALPLDPCGIVEEPARLEVSLSNDAFGPGPVQDWDDLRTFGGEISVLLDSHDAIEASFDAFTDRSPAARTGSRIDRIETLIRHVFLQVRAGMIRLRCAAAIGIVAYGAFGGLAMQEKLHEGVGVSRPAPRAYDSQRLIGPSAAGEIQLALDDLAPVVPSLVASAIAEAPGSWQVESGAEVSIGGIDSRIAAWATYRYRSGGVSPAADTTSSLMCGPIAGFSVDAGVLTSSIEIDPLAGTTGTFGLSLDPQETPAGPPLALEIFSNVSVLSPGRRVLFPLFGPDLRGYVEVAHGWWTAAGNGATGYRSSEYGAGLEARSRVSLGMLTAEIGCGAGPFASIVTLQRTGVERSSILDAAVLLGLRLQSLFRLGFGTTGRNRAENRSGIGASFCFDVPPVPIGSVASAIAATNQMFKVRVFLYSEVQ